MIVDEPIKLPLPEELRSGIGKSLPTTLRVSISGIKGLKFKDIKTDSIPTNGPIPTEVSFKIDRLPGHSIQFYRLRFPIPEKANRKSHLQKFVYKRAFVIPTLVIAALATLFLLRRRIPLLNRKPSRKD
jgi:hypothetical protein